ncbi:MAG: putative Ig domain-containing protein [Thermoplasmatota archaeon]
MGKGVSGAGDVNGDGYDDILIGEQGNRTVHLFFGRPSNEWSMDMNNSIMDVSFIDNIPAMNNYIGEALSGAGDVNGDGFDDILIGNFMDHAGNEDCGKTHLVFGRETSLWPEEFDLADSNASFIGEGWNDQTGGRVMGGGDVNGDGYDDILISSKTRNYPLGETYLILGKNSGWTMNTNLSNSDASYLGEGSVGEVHSMDMDGDFNKDGYDDILLGCGNTDGQGNLRGKAYVIFGKESGWSLRTYLSGVDASFIGEADSDHCGWGSSNAGDVNQDGYDDILIGSMGNAEKAFTAGQVYVIFGKPTGWESSVRLWESDASFQGHDEWDFLGQSVAGLGDVNGDGVDDFIMAGPHVQCDNSGKIYLVFGLSTTDPIEVHSLDLYSDQDYSIDLEMADRLDYVYLELIGEDGNASTTDFTLVNISFSVSEPSPMHIRLKETGANTGVYRGAFRVPLYSEYLETVNFSSGKDPTKFDSMIVNTDVLIFPYIDKTTVLEDQEYRNSYWNAGWTEYPKWTMTANKDWLHFDEETRELHGTPDNGDVGFTKVNLTLSDILGHKDVRLFMISVDNVKPTMTGEDIQELYQGEYFETDYSCDDDGQGNVTYYVTSNLNWLQIDRYSGLLNGTPENDDVGTSMVQISVHDGNGGWDSRQFNLTVYNINDAPRIITDDITSVFQDDPFVRNYVAEEIDADDEIRWELQTDADFLSIDEEMGTLSGTPTYLDVGVFFVNVSVWDLSNAFDFHNFTLTVKNINDPPVWTDFPSNTEIVHGKRFLFDVNATDHDNDMMTFYVSSNPASDITIDEFTGLINWTADIHMFENEPYRLEVKVSVLDGYVYVNRTFTITVLPTDPPSVELTGPANSMRTSSIATVLEWEGTDPEDEPISYDVYVHQTEAFVIGLREEALHASDHIGDNITVTGLEPGRTYFWTVIPNDGCSDGACTSGVLSFRVNYKPTFKTVEDQKVSAGTDFKYKISCTDQDAEDIPNLRYSLKEAPTGMTISEETGMIRWTPRDDQVMLHTVTVEVSDGIESNTITFEIEVAEGESSTTSLLLIILIAVIAIILVALGIFLVLRVKKNMDAKALEKGEEERAALEKEREEEYLSYEQLYGVPAPSEEEVEEEITTAELKEAIHEQIERLEQMDTSEE